jgi:hypothetical protein
MNTNTLGYTTNPFKLSQIVSKADRNQKIQPPIDQSSEYLNSLINQYTNEIYLLKRYIERINKEIRQNLNMEIPSIDEVLSTITINENSAFDQNTLNQLLNKTINVEYINPLLSLYDTHIQNLENELKLTKDILKKKDNQLSDLVNENNKLRIALEQRNFEFKNFIEVKANTNNSESIKVMDFEYVMKLEERNNKLSQENEILLNNYTNSQKELLEFKMKVNNTFQNNNNKALAYDELIGNYEMLKKSYDELIEINKVNQLKMFDLSDKVAQLESENNDLKDKEEMFNQQIMQLEGSLKFYKDFADKLNQN